MSFEALAFAAKAHKNQVRKYTGCPYIGHPIEVAGLVACVAHEYPEPADSLINAALLHDCIEDQAVTHAQIKEQFGVWVADAVLMLSDSETGTRAQRKAASCVRLSSAGAAVQTIKCADIIVNTRSIALRDPKFAVLYLQEKRRMLEVLTKAHAGLLTMAWAQCATQDMREPAIVEPVLAAITKK